MRACTLVLVLVACGGAEPERKPAASKEPPLPTPYVAPEPPAREPLLAPADMEEAIALGLQVAMGTDAAPMFERYQALLERGAAAGCPYMVSADDGAGGLVTYWQSECRTAAGAHFGGTGYLGTYADRTYGTDPTLYTGWYLYHSGRMEDATESFDGAGSASGVVGTGEGYTAFSMNVDGTFVVSGDDRFDGHKLPSLVMYASIWPSLDGRYVYLDGGIAGLRSRAGTIAFAKVEAMQAALGSACDREPGGTISVRDEDGDWYDVSFDGFRTGATLDPTLCDGCGTAWFEGRELGRVCPDFARLFRWNASPW